MDSMVNRYTSDRREEFHGRRLYANGEASVPTAPSSSMPSVAARYGDAAVVIGSIEDQPAPHRALRLLVGQGQALGAADSKADLLIFGNAERALVELAHRLAAAESRSATCAAPAHGAARLAAGADWVEIDSTNSRAPVR